MRDESKFEVVPDSDPEMEMSPAPRRTVQPVVSVDACSMIDGVLEYYRLSRHLEMIAGMEIITM